MLGTLYTYVARLILLPDTVAVVVFSSHDTFLPSPLIVKCPFSPVYIIAYFNWINTVLFRGTCV